MSDGNVIDIITRQVVEKVAAEVDARIDAGVKIITDEVQHRVDGYLAGLPQDVEAELVVDPPPAKADARDRAWRTTVQGAVATVLIAVLLALADLLGTGTLDLATSGAWKAIAGTAGGAALMAVLAYVQRLISPPKER
ncbi:hypothetical protein I0Q12_09975 [Rhodococcus sp. CX]|uniref:hypothetical protein n=1 Tax=Rhodococcus sp. CX TaxID=2789880 RepID=UPI0018CD38CC|nr:hypothetical protein [Rhodococcus sp. CX]MBH0119824.1 hypothetical protein [Rhodococcus sp. CX]